MTDHGDGTYTASYLITASKGTISIGVIHVFGSIEGDYYTDTAWTNFGGTGSIDTLNYSWGYGNVGPLS